MFFTKIYTTIGSLWRDEIHPSRRHGADELDIVADTSVATTLIATIWLKIAGSHKKIEFIAIDSSIIAGF
jgi:hypothetical protein